MTPHDWLSLVDSIGGTLFGIVFVFCLFGGIPVTSRIIRERIERKERHRQEDREDHG